MGSSPIGTQRNNSEGVPPEEGRLVPQREQPSGISDDRRAELERLQDAIGPATDATSKNDRPKRPESDGASLLSAPSGSAGEVSSMPAADPDPADPANHKPKTSGLA